MRAPGRLAAASVALAIAATLGACAPALPDTVDAGTEVVVGWAAELTSLNPVAAPTPGNLDIAAVTRDGFGDIVDGEFVADPAFGKVSMIDGGAFTVRYDLAEPAWSDGIPLDGADLMLGWAAAAGLLDDSASGEPAPPGTEPPLATPTPKLDEFARAIEVAFPAPTISWQSAVRADVPAHVVGRIAFGIDDPMEAKQAVIGAIQERDERALGEIAEAWRDGFALDEDFALSEGEASPETFVSSGPYRVAAVARAADGQSVTLVPNGAYRGAPSPQVARVELVPPGDAPLGEIGERLDIATVAPVVENRAPVRELERRDTGVQTTHDGTVWTVLLRPAGVFGGAPARSAFLRSIPASDLIDRGAGEWSSAYTKTTALTAAPGSRAFDIVSEDSGFASTLGAAADDGALEREAAGVAAGTAVCVLYDRTSAFAAGAFSALRDAVGEEGWSATDCGSDDLNGALAGGAWDAVITRVEVLDSVAGLKALWGIGTTSAVTAQVVGPLAAGQEAIDRDALLAELDRTVDVYQARELRAQIEATLVRSAIAKPLAANPRVTVVDKDVTGVTVRNGTRAPLLSGAAQWKVEP